MFQNVGFEWIVEYKNKIKFHIQELCTRWIFNGLWYNLTICLQLHGYLFENYSNTGRKYRYDLICVIYTYNKKNPPKLPDYAISGSDRPLLSTSLTRSLESLGHKLEFIGQCIQCFESNFSTRVSMYNDKML